MTRAGQIIEADEATAHLFADRDEPDTIELRGNARITGGEGMGALRLMRARDINLDYADDGRTLQQATLAGQAAIRMAGAAAGAEQQLNGEFIAFDLPADGAIKNLASRDQVVVDAAGRRRTRRPARFARSSSTGSGAPGQGLTTMTFQDNVVFVEAAAKDRGARARRAPASARPAAQPLHRAARGREVRRQRSFRGRRAGGAERRGDVSHDRQRSGPARPRQQRCRSVRQRRAHPD